VAQLRWLALDAAAFTQALDECLAVYAAAMDPPAEHLPGRRAIMARHADYPGFRAVAACRDAQPCPVVAFAYGFHGETGQWWHDLVLAAVGVTAGLPLASRWLADSFEIGEVHVDPGHQGIGVGRQMLLRLTTGRAERTAVLSTRDASSPARHLYRKLGFTDLLTAFCFPGGPDRYAVMGAALPLRSDGHPQADRG
jgi:ribosomal protein S18 acetylase RimI-like enzyme